MTSETKHSVSFISPKRARSSSHTEARPSMSDRTEAHELSSSDIKRNHSASVSSVTSHLSEESDPVFRRQRYSVSELDLEKQLMMTAGGNDASVCCFILKGLFLCTVVLGCGVLVFYAL